MDFEKLYLSVGRPKFSSRERIGFIKVVKGDITYTQFFYKGEDDAYNKYKSLISKLSKAGIYYYYKDLGGKNEKS